MSETRAQYGEAGEAKHAPGPWEALPTGNLVRTLFVPGSNTHRGKLVADLYAQGQGLPTAEREATARLIAAAPDLLNIAKRVVSALEDLEDDPPPRYRTRSHDLRDDAREAIAKATAAPSRKAQPPAEPRELLCMLCSTEHAPWFAPNELWNAAVRRPDGADEFPFLCPTCFTTRAVAAGIDQVFVLSTDTEPHEREAEMIHEIERLRKALEKIQQMPPRAIMDGNARPGDPHAFGYSHQLIARAALNHAAPKEVATDG